VADLSSDALMFSLGAARWQNPSTEWKWKQVEALGLQSGLIESGPSGAMGGRASTSF
jgi:hypothetical protein